MGRGASTTQSSGILYGSPFQTRPRRIVRPRVDPVAAMRRRADELIEKLTAELDANPIREMDPICFKMNEDTRKMQIGILKVVATDPESLWGARALRHRARIEHGEGGVGDHATSSALDRLMADGYLELVGRTKLRMIL